MEPFDPDIFWNQVRSSGECWLWTGKTLNGYGVVRDYRFTEMLAHRLSWTMARGPIPGGMWVLHHCDTPACVNPEHLYIGTASDNAQDRERRGRGNHPTGISRPRPRWTHCKRGHELTADNVRRFGDGSVRCRTCACERDVQRRARARQAVAA